MGVLFHQVFANATNLNIVNDDAHKVISWRDVLGSVPILLPQKNAMVQKFHCKRQKLLLRHSLWKKNFHETVPKRVWQILQAFGGRLLTLLWGTALQTT